MPAKILVADDEPDLELLILHQFRKKIEKEEFQFVFVQNGVEALEKLKEEPDIDLVLTDINMPKMDGLTLLGKLKDLNAILKTVIVSAYGDMKNIRTAMNRGAFDFLTKPIDFEDLEITVNKTLQYVQQLKESLRLRQEKEEAQKEALAQERLARFIRVVFGRYLTDEVVATLLESPEGLKLGGEKRAVCILMSDLRGFTSLSERLTPEQVITILNRYLGAMVDIILKYQGTIVEFIGDAIMVLFGAPIKREDDVQRAVACAVSMQLAMTLINEQNRQEGLPELEMGIGLNMGEVVVGNIGSHKRTKYGVVGSHVNLTARIESCTVGGQILVSEAILKEEGSILRIGEQMEVEAKGFEKPITIYDLRGIGGAHNLFLPEEDDIFFSLGEEVQVRYTVLEGKQSGGTIFAGNLIKLSAKGGEIYSENLVAPLSNLKMRFMRTYSNETPGDVYGKVIEKLTKDRNCFFVRFTFVPPEVEAFLWDLLH